MHSISEKSSDQTFQYFILFTLYCGELRRLHEIYGLPGHFEKNFHKYQMKIGPKLDDTPSLDHLAVQEVPHHLPKVQ